MRTAAIDAHGRSIALMKFLSGVAKKLGVAEHVYVVGGAVRNFLIDQPIKDIDVVVDSVALKGQDSGWFAEKVQNAIPVRSNLTTNQYGVAILTVSEPWALDGHEMKGEVIEIANARKESYGGAEGKGYKPHMVEPATIEEDLVRREFTFNTLLWRLSDLTHGPEHAEVLDLLGQGREHLEKGELHTPADPDKTFSDDPTRMLRALKFVAKYNFKVPPDLAEAIRRNAPKLAQMPWDAVRGILTNDILDAPNPRRSIVLLKEFGLAEVLKHMLHTMPGMSAALSRTLNEHETHVLLDLLDLEWAVKTPLSFLSREQHARLRELLLANAEDPRFDLQLVEALKKPPVNQEQLFKDFSIPPKERQAVSQIARAMILDNPGLVMNGLVEAVTEELRKRYPATTASTAERVAFRFVRGQ
jgi:tRNA nucleotidyltransferase/poly(A) polymerase